MTGLSGLDDRLLDSTGITRLNTWSPAFNRLPELVDRLARSPRGDRNFASVVAKVNRAIEEAFPEVLSERPRVRRSGRAPTAYGVRLPDGQVTLRAEA